MEQLQQVQQEQEVILERSIGNLFEENPAQVLRTKVLPTQELRFHPAVAGG